MALRPDQLDWMSRYVGGAPREELSAEIPGMFGEVTPEMQAAAFGGPDARTAQNMSTDPAMSSAAPSDFAPTPENIAAAQRAAPPPPAPVATDAGGMSGGGPAMSVAPEPTMSTVTPEMQAQMGAQAQARLAASQAPQAAPQMAPYDPVGRSIQSNTRALMRSTPGRVMPGGENLDTRTVSRELHGRLSPETAQALEDDNIDAQGLAVGQAESAAQGIEAQAQQQGAQAKEARAQLAAYKRENATKQTEYEMRQSELDDMRSDIEKNPATYWSGKDTGTQILNAIGLIILGLGGKDGGGQLIQPIMEAEIARKQKERGAAISLLQDRLNRFKDGMPSPEAQQLYIRSLTSDAVASEAARLASLAKAEDVRQRGFALAEQYKRDALMQRAAAETGLLGKEEVKTKNEAPKVIGGKRGLTIDEIAKKYNKPIEWVVENLESGALPGGAGGGPQDDLELAKTKYERSVAVRLPNGETAYASDPDQKKELQGALAGSTALQSIYEDLAKIRENHAVTGQWDRKAIGRAKVNVSKITLQLKKAEQLGVLSAGDLQLIEPLTGGGIEDYIVGPQFDGALERSRELNNASSQSAMQLLSSSPWSAKYITNPAGGTGSTARPRE